MSCGHVRSPPRCHTKCCRSQGLKLCNACTITARLRPPTDRVPPSRLRASLACNHSKLTKTQPLCHASKERLPEPCSRFGNKQAGTQSASLRRQVHAPSRSRLRPQPPASGLRMRVQTPRLRKQRVGPRAPSAGRQRRAHGLRAPLGCSDPRKQQGAWKSPKFTSRCSKTCRFAAGKPQGSSSLQ